MEKAIFVEKWNACEALHLWWTLSLNFFTRKSFLWSGACLSWIKTFPLFFLKMRRKTDALVHTYSKQKICLKLWQNKYWPFFLTIYGWKMYGVCGAIYEYWSLYNKGRYEYRSVCNMGGFIRQGSIRQPCLEYWSSCLWPNSWK